MRLARRPLVLVEARRSLTMVATDPLSTVFAALADPTRRAILARLAKGPATVKELAAPFTMSGPAVSKHLRVLEHAGLIARGREAQWRPCTLDAAPLKEVAAWAENYRKFWDASFQRLDEYLKTMKTEEKSHGQRKQRR
jgi:DNA-binding transcriptional ArsR family regulator